MRRSKLYTPLLVSIVLFGAYYFVHVTPVRGASMLALRERIFGTNLNYLLFAAIIPLVVFVVRLLDAIVFDLIFSRRRGVNAPLLLRQIISVGLYLFLLAGVFSWLFDRSVSGLLVGTTVLAAVVGLALQETLGNLFAGISLHMERPFDVGDVIRIGDLSGMVESVNWRATRIRSFNDSYLVLPNSAIARDRLEVFPMQGVVARVITVNASYDAAPVKVIEVLEQVVGNVDGVAAHPRALARMGAFGESGATYEIKYWTAEYFRHPAIDAAIRRAVWYAFRRNHINIPYPTRAIHQAQVTAEAPVVSTAEIQRRIDEVEILAPLSPDERARLTAETRVHQFAGGETILRQHDHGDSMFIVHSGTVAVRMHDEGGERREVAQLGEGSIFGEMALLTGEERMADVVAITHVIALEIGKSSLQPVLAANPSLASALTARVMERRSLSSHHAEEKHDEERSVLSRIRSYFGV